MFNWPTVSTLFGVLTSFSFMSVIAVFSWFAYVLRSNDKTDFSQPSSSPLSGEIPAGECMYVCMYVDLYRATLTA